MNSNARIAPIFSCRSASRIPDGDGRRHPLAAGVLAIRAHVSQHRRGQGGVLLRIVEAPAKIRDRQRFQKLQPLGFRPVVDQIVLRAASAE